MAQKNRISIPAYIPGVAANMVATITGGWINIEGIDNISFQALWTGTPTGTFEFDVSNDGPIDDAQTNKPSGTLGATALTLPSSMTVAAAVPSGSGGNFYFDFNQLSAKWIRMKYVLGSSTGQLSVGVFGKAI